MPGSIQKFAASPTLKAGSGKNNILRLGWGMREMSEGQLAGLEEHRRPWSSRTVSLLPQDTSAAQATEGRIVELPPTPRGQEWAAMKDLFPTHNTCFTSTG